MFPRLAIFLLLFASCAAHPALAQDPPPPERPAWYGRVAAVEPGSFVPLRAFQANYRVAWSGLEAARVNAEATTPPGGPQFRTEVHATTTGTARLLYKLDVLHVSVIDRNTFRPQSINQTEQNSRNSTATRVDFTAEGATRTDRANSARKPKFFPYPGMLDMEGMFLQFRSLPLADGDEKTYLLMTPGNPYLVTLKVLGHGPVHVQAGDFSAIQCSLRLEKVGKHGELEPRKGFKSGTAWLSDDTNRLLIKAQVDAFIGTVSLELENVRYLDASR